jgi:hypothetical protein
MVSLAPSECSDYSASSSCSKYICQLSRPVPKYAQLLRPIVRLLFLALLDARLTLNSAQSDAAGMPAITERLAGTLASPVVNSREYGVKIRNCLGTGVNLRIMLKRFGIRNAARPFLTRDLVLTERLAEALSHRCSVRGKIDVHHAHQLRGRHCWTSGMSNAQRCV